MSRSLLVVLAAFCAIQYVRATCDQGTIDKIKEGRKGVDDSNLIKELQDTFEFISVKYGANTPTYKEKCLSVTFDGSSIEIKGAVEAKFLIKYDGEKIISSDDNGEEVINTYVVAKEGSGGSKCVALFSCTPSDEASIDFTGVAVSKSAGSISAADLEKCKAALSNIGVTDGVEVPRCA